MDELMNTGSNIATEANQMMDNWETKYKNTTIDEGFTSFGIVDEYHSWLSEIRDFIKNNLGKNNVNLHYFDEKIEEIPTTDWLDKNRHMYGDYIPFSLLKDIFNETKKKMALLGDIYQKNENIFDKKDKEISFNDRNRQLHFVGKDIIISKKEDGDSHKLLRTIFKDKNKIWNNDEILEDWGYGFGEKGKKNKIYQAGLKVNEIIAQETTIKDFLNVSTKSININEKYL